MEIYKGITEIIGLTSDNSIGINNEDWIRYKDPSFPQGIYLDLDEDNKDNSITLYHSKEGLKRPFEVCRISTKFINSNEKEE